MRPKHELLAILSGTVCAICYQPKKAYTWTCSACFRPNENTPEQRMLSVTCDAHMMAADTFLQLVRRRQQPESD
jgi:hypothetical protein